MDHLVERLFDFPDLLDAELEALRVETVDVEVIERGVGQVPDHAFGEDGALGDQVHAGLEVAELLALTAAAAVTGADSLDDLILDQQLVGRGLGQDVGAHLLGLFGEEAGKLGDGSDVVAVVLEVRRHRLERKRKLLGQQVNRVLLDLAVDRPLIPRHVGEELLHRGGAHVGAGHAVGTTDLALLDHGHRDLAELLHQLGLVLEQLKGLDRGGETGRTTADDRYADFNALIFGIGGRNDDAFGIKGGRILGGRYGRHALVLSGRLCGQTRSSSVTGSGDSDAAKS